MTGLCEGGNESAGSLKAIYFTQSLMLAGNEFQSLGRAIVKEDEYEEVRWDGIVSIVSWRACVQIVVGRKVSEARRQVRRNRRVQDFEEKEK
ncbi:hypothetical protein ANN_20159 [Periplaneta americana]|uniref:Uncharacterized protein n=1 Tax=Periplaneta americana TaxID=6978 RepID=A0ABQ8SC26_PERAM|nr:hypothetical protein ANN_20159 [Periplaneta americana]